VAAEQQQCESCATVDTCVVGILGEGPAWCVKGSRKHQQTCIGSAAFDESLAVLCLHRLAVLMAGQA
jgi:uncharacterized protein (UPF0179 family)